MASWKLRPVFFSSKRARRLYAECSSRALDLGSNK